MRKAGGWGVVGVKCPVFSNTLPGNEKYLASVHVIDGMCLTVVGCARNYCRSVRSALESGSDLWDEDEASFGTENSVNNLWEWLEGPVVDVLFADRNARCNRHTNIEP